MKNFKKASALLLLFATLALFAFALTTGNFTLFILGAASCALLATTQPGVLTACVIDCSLGAMSSGTDCKIRGGLKVAYWAQYDDIDWAAMAVSALHFNTTTQVILDYIMVSSAVFYKLEFERKQGKYSFTFSEDADVYEQVITLVFEGKSAALRAAFAKSISCCKLILHVFDNNCLSRTVGVEWDGDTFSIQLKSLRVGRHADESGETGTDKARDEMDIVGESIPPPLFSSILEADMPV